jgi:hypothetical protein
MSEKEIAEIFDRVFSLPIHDRARLAHALIDSLSAGEHPKATRPDIASLRGLLSNGQTPPTDEQVKQWIDEHRMEKYG